ncbi:Vegetative incompatibility protein HET-E-1 [Pseudocercospora fuligena]|uniref:Vegetative incompatibility protein HET-E-1 n=1 Tax=Pseudocercospora fuligena TaxID=685502 RepID=A0A8H6VGE0_9PEZI|nr:Vegetative incompatibility protein HET-E-1 [Pseudocercospora fuligena]
MRYLWKWAEEKDGTERIANIAGLPVPVLRDPSRYSDYSTAQRLSWATKRTTSRLEDHAYCLLGILDVNMPLMYGERNKAFVRLQQELIRTSVDESILSWSLTGQDLNYIHEAPESDQGTRFTPLLASSPAAFANEADTRPESLLYPRIQVESGLVKLESGPDNMCYALGANTYFVYLRCQHRPADNDPHPSEIDRSAQLAWSIIALRLEACGHFVRLHKGRVDAPFNRSNASFERVDGSRCGAMTFYVHASSDCTMARIDRRSKEEDTNARMAVAPPQRDPMMKKMILKFETALQESRKT